MARIFITGSADGLGQMAARLLVQQGHTVVLHARNPSRARQAMEAVSGAQTVLHADLSSISQTIQLAKEANQIGQFDAVIHNAAVGYRESRRIATVDGLPQVFAVNSLAPYILSYPTTRPAHLSQLRPSPAGRRRSGRSGMEKNKMGWL